MARVDLANRTDADEEKSARLRVASQFRELWLRCYVRSKLRRDPIYAAAYELLRSSDAPILDVGCGVGLLAFYLRERGFRPSILGLDVDQRKTERGKWIASRYADLDLRCADVRESIPAFSGNVAMFDMLHYLPPLEQIELLSRLTESVAPGELLIIRQCPRDNSARFWMTWIMEKLGQAITWNLDTAISFPSRERIAGAFHESQFERDSWPLWGRLPFNNQLFVFRRRVSETAPVAG
jgi:2-polyprenyl-3-methyl-5-hydroxy-6-metoxy-1,4-benzoquinol methylase